MCNQNYTTFLRLLQRDEAQQEDAYISFSQHFERRHRHGNGVTSPPGAGRSLITAPQMNVDE
jgi:hypothetical protein